MNNFFYSIDSIFEKAEQRFGRGLVWVLTGIFFLLSAALVSAVRFETSYHGNDYTLLSSNPFDFKQVIDLRFRILSPLLGYVLYLRGPVFKYFMLFVLAVFFGLIYFFLRREKYRPSEALGVTALLSFSTLSFYQFYFPAYTDPMSFMLIILYFYLFRNIFLNTILLSLLLFNHENSLFLFPFFFLLSLNGDNSIKNILTINMRFIIAVIPYLIYRFYVDAHTEVGFNTSYYFDPYGMKWTREHVAPHLLEGIFQAFRLSWIFPIAAIAINLYEKRFREILLMIVIVVFVLMQLIIAWDISRLVGFAFPVILIAANRMRIFLGTEKFLILTYSVVLINFFIPAYCIGALDPIPYTPFWLR